MKDQFLFWKIVVLLVLSGSFVSAKSILSADGPGDTYELINSVLAPGNTAVESPDCAHSDFGRHIDEVFDAELNEYVFRFHIHKSPDNDRCKKFDRQRLEIKTYDKSPDSLLGVSGETVEYHWKFKLDSAFQSSNSFTHIHQIKAVGGTETGMPVITLSTRKGSPDQLELNYAAHSSQDVIIQADLAPILGEWTEVTERILYGETGSAKYSIVVKRMSDALEVLSYQSNDLRMWRDGASFLRPKWGIYRSLNDSVNLRDEQLLFADFSIEELDSFVSSMNRQRFQIKNVHNPKEAIQIVNSMGKIVTKELGRFGSKKQSALKTGLYVLPVTIRH